MGDWHEVAVGRLLDRTNAPNCRDERVRRYAVSDPACLWFLARNKNPGGGKMRDRRGEVLFIDARKLGTLVDRTRKEFSDQDVAKIAASYHAWREGKGYEDLPGFCKAVKREEIGDHNYVLTPGRYVGAVDIENDAVPFPERFAPRWHRGCPKGRDRSPVPARHYPTFGGLPARARPLPLPLAPTWYLGRAGTVGPKPRATGQPHDSDHRRTSHGALKQPAQRPRYFL
ncbi:MAG: N-6 DNA methylase [Phyllobacterium sp.]|uniref:N-6 DNA methylase n=1 Tax=Phyllobacterium sp. TaxID=1871046 RepID=UPI0030F00FB4